jgi:hypothetical protein
VPVNDIIYINIIIIMHLWSSGQLLATDPKVASSIADATRFSEKQWVWNGVHSASLALLRSHLNEK